MNFKQIKKSSTIDKLSITERQILHIIPDFDTPLNKSIMDIPLNHRQVQFYIIKSGLFKLGRKTLNPKEYYNNSKKLLIDNHMNVKRTIPKELSQNKFIIIDHTIAMQAVRFIAEKSSEKSALFYLLQYLKKEISVIKQTHPTFNQNILFDLTVPNGLNELLSQLTKFNHETLNSEYKMFDEWMLAASHAGDDVIILPIMGFNNGKVELYRSKLLQAKSNVKAAEPLKVKVKLSETDNDTDSSKLTKDIVTDTLRKDIVKKDDELSSKIVIDRRKLSGILKRYKIKDPILANNVKSAVDDYIKVTEDDQIKQDNVELVVLKAINKSIYNTDVLPEEYIDNPNKLFSKLSQSNSYSEKISYPKIDNQAVTAKDIINFDTVTGPVRHKFEFSENLDFAMATMFKSLQKLKNHPIEVVNIKKDIKDNNLHRFYEYTITLKNQIGGEQEPYDVKIKVPALVNDRYFKLGGNEYIMVSQQYLQPLTKDKDNEVRFLTHYNMTRLSVQNLKFNISQVQDILNYINLKYAEIVTETKTDDKNNIHYIKFSNAEIFDLTSLTPYNGISTNLEYIDGLYYEVSKVERFATPIKIGNERNEFLYKKLIKQISRVNPSDKLNKSVRTIPYIRIHIIGQKIPLILFIAQHMGLLNALTKVDIDYEIGESLERPEPNLTLSLANGQNLYIYTKDLRQELIANGLIHNHMAKKFINMDVSELNKKETYDEMFRKIYGATIIKKIDEVHEKSIDPTTAELLDFYDYPDNFLDVLIEPGLEKLLNSEVDHGGDLAKLRVRQSEVFTNILYDQMMLAASTYSDNVGFDASAKLRFDEEYLISNLLGKHIHAKNDGGALLELSTPYSPYAELTLASKVSKSGKGGIPNSRMLKKNMRSVHPSYMGQIGANSFGESDPGATNYHSLGVNISNTFGSYGFKPNDDNSETDNIDSLSIDEALTPFVDQLNADRLVLARTHVNQRVPLVKGKGESAIVETGAEAIVTQIASKKFVSPAPDSGRVLSVKENESITVEYDNGKKEIHNLLPRFSNTKRGSTIINEMSSLKKGDKFKKADLIAWSNFFDGKTTANGRNSTMAIMNYMGTSYEDAYVVTESMADDYVVDTTEKIDIIIPPNAKVTNFIKDKLTSNGDTLIEFQYTSSIDEYIENFNMDTSDLVDDDNALFVGGNDTVKRLSPGGEIIDIRIKVNNMKEVDPFIQEMHKNIVNDIKKKQKSLSKFTPTMPVDNIDTSQFKVGNHKFKSNMFEGALITFYIKTSKKMQLGDKLCNRFGAKGVIGEIIPNSSKPTTEFSGDIDVFLAPAGLLGRKNTSIIKELYLAKLIKALPEKIKPLSISKAKQLIFDVYNTLDKTKTKKIIKAIKSNINSVSDTELKKLFKSGEYKFNFILPPFVKMSFEALIEAAEILDVPLDEKVFIPALGMWSKEAVPVGPTYMSRMEQTANDYASTRSVAGYVSATGQPVKGKSKNGGQSVGWLDVQAFLAGDNLEVMKELMGPRSDFKRSKNIMISNLIAHGESDLVTIPSEKGKTKELFNTIMVGMGLHIKQ